MNDARLAGAVAAALEAAPHLDTETAYAAIADAATSGRERNLLAAWMADHADALVTGESGAPLVVARVVDALRSMGVGGLSRPRCASCGRERKLPYVIAGGRLCTTCFRQATAELCSRCNRIQPVATRDDAGAVCNSCHRKDPATHELCRSCGQLGTVATRRGGGPLCHRCYERPPDRCARCGEDRPIHSRRSGEPECDRCYRQPTGHCTRCGTDGPLAVRGEVAGSGICESCYETPLVTCASCGETRRTAAKSDDGPLCARCATRPTATCSRCGQDRPVQRRGAEGPICSTCYDAVHRVSCQSCGQLCRPYERLTCARCVLRQRVDEVLPRGASGSLEPLRVALVQVDQPRSTLRWLDKSSGAALLADLAHGRIPLSHEGLDSAGPSKPAEHVRGLLMATGAIELRDVHHDRLEPWLEDLLETVDARHVSTVRAFAVWHVFRRVRGQAKRGRLTENGVKWARLRVRQAVSVLRWLDDHGRALEDITQADVDLWLAGGPTTRYAARDFLIGARRRDLAPHVRIPLRQVVSPAGSADDDERWQQVDRLLGDDGTDLVVRVAGLFALLFGQHISRVAALERDAVVEHADGSVAVSFGAEPLTLPPRVDALVVALTRGTGHASVTTDRWLFPGGVPGRHISAEQLRKRLADEAGITLRSARNAALLQLAGELPAPVLADLLGLHVNTAVEWIRSARGDWSAYAAAGARRGER